ncbi:MAG: MFS transporter, partial [Chloroflexota bacterium]
MAAPSIAPAYDQITPRVMWQVVIVSALAQFMIFGIRLSYQLFQSQFVNVEGWSSQESAGIYSLSMLVFGILATPSGILLDRFGPRIVFSVGATLLAVGLFLSSYASTAAELRITYGLIGGAGLSVIGLGPIAGNIATFVPPRLRGRAIGVAFAGTGVGTLVFIPFYTWIMAAFGWRNTFLFQAVLSLALIVPLLAFGLKNPTHIEKTTATGSNPTGGAGALLRIPLFWVLIVVSLTALGPLRALTVHQLAYLEEIGFQRTTAAGYVGLAGLMTFGAYLMWGWFSDRFGRAMAFTLGAIALGGAVLLLFVLRQV